MRAAASRKHNKMTGRDPQNDAASAGVRGEIEQLLLGHHYSHIHIFHPCNFLLQCNRKTKRFNEPDILAKLTLFFIE